MGQDKSVHSKILTEAARQVLRPMGLTQKGRSRTWLDDHGWWLCVVEFQPSGWSRGSYLNVGCMWLWDVKDDVAFHEGYRVADFSEFRDEVQFAAVAMQLAHRAAREARRYRRRFPNVGKVCRFYAWHPPVGLWANFHAGIACALAGRPKRALRFFDRVMREADKGIDWMVAAKVDAQHLAAIAGEREEFRQTIGERVRRTRDLLKLSPNSALSFDE
jgi:hypothetical protein